MNAELRRKDVAILTSVTVQIVGLVSLALLDTFLRGQHLRIWLVIQVVFPILLTFDAAHNWSKDPVSREIAAIINFFYGCIFGLGVIKFLFGLGVITGPVSLIRDISWISLGKFTLMVTITATYFLNVCLLEPNLRLRLPKNS